MMKSHAAALILALSAALALGLTLRLLPQQTVLGETGAPGGPTLQSAEGGGGVSPLPLSLVMHIACCISNCTVLISSLPSFRSVEWPADRGGRGLDCI
jgi:hypothetical protein